MLFDTDFPWLTDRDAHTWVKITDFRKSQRAVMGREINQTDQHFLISHHTKLLMYSLQLKLLLDRSCDAVKAALQIPTHKKKKPWNKHCCFNTKLPHMSTQSKMQIQFLLQPSCLMFWSFPSAQILFYNHLHVLLLFILTFLELTQIPSDLHLLKTFIHLLINAVYSRSTSQGCWSLSQHTWGERQETTADSSPLHRRARRPFTHPSGQSDSSIN